MHWYIYMRFLNQFSVFYFIISSLFFFFTQIILVFQTISALFVSNVPLLNKVLGLAWSVAFCRVQHSSCVGPGRCCSCTSLLSLPSSPYHKTVHKCYKSSNIYENGYNLNIFSQIHKKRYIIRLFKFNKSQIISSKQEMQIASCSQNGALWSPISPCRASARAPVHSSEGHPAVRKPCTFNLTVLRSFLYGLKHTV